MGMIRDWITEEIENICGERVFADWYAENREIFEMVVHKTIRNIDKEYAICLGVIVNHIRGNNNESD
jgi:hypothetical protein